MRVIASLLVSTDKQDTSMDAQRKLIGKGPAYQEHEVVARPGSRTYPSSGRTAFKERARVAETTRTLLAREAKDVAATKLNRLSRDVADFATVLERFRDRDWTPAALDLDIDAATPHGEMFAIQLAKLAQWKCRMISARTKAALAELKRQDRGIGRPTELSLDSPAIRHIRKAHAKGSSTSQIAHELNPLGLRPPRGCEFYPASVTELLQRAERGA